jgi:hypothetical protein
MDLSARNLQIGLTAARSTFSFESPPLVAEPRPRIEGGLMLNGRSLALGACPAVLLQMVHAVDDAARRIGISAPKRIVEAQHGKRIELSFDQRPLLLGAHAVNPMTPSSLPRGDGAAPATVA